MRLKEAKEIKSVVEKKVFAVLSEGAHLLKLAVSSVIHSMRNNLEQYISLIWDNFSSANYNIPSYPDYTNNYITQDFEALLLNDVTKIYSLLAKDLVDEILSNYDIISSQSSLPLILPSGKT